MTRQQMRCCTGSKKTSRAEGSVRTTSSFKPRMAAPGHKCSENSVLPSFTSSPNASSGDRSVACCSFVRCRLKTIRSSHLLRRMGIISLRLWSKRVLKLRRRQSGKTISKSSTTARSSEAMSAWNTSLRLVFHPSKIPACWSIRRIKSHREIFNSKTAASTLSSPASGSPWTPITQPGLGSIPLATALRRRHRTGGLDGPRWLPRL